MKKTTAKKASSTAALKRPAAVAASLPSVTEYPAGYERFLKSNQSNEESKDTKKYYWFPDKDAPGEYMKGEYKSGKEDDKEGDIVLLNTFGDSVTFKRKQVFECNPSRFDGVDDLGDLTYLSEASVFHNLKLRYVDNRIHSYSGLFLVVVNPYKMMPIYTPEIVRYYNGKRRSEVAPHVFAVADEAYRSMINTQKNSSMLVTGESGAGKTENTKKIIYYLTQISGNRGSSKQQLEEQILQSNPILEAFGNAKTLRNDNSSRFGKFIQVQFTSSGSIAGASIDHYLLEVSRVVRQNAGERNYHVFYQLLSGLNDASRMQFKLKKPEDYAYLNHSGCTVVDSVDDKKDFEDMSNAFDIMGVDPQDKESMYRVLAAILHLGNIKFTENKQEQSDCDGDAVINAATLLKVPVDDLRRSLTKQAIVAGGQMIVKDLNAEKASFGRHALVKSLYSRMFDWIVKRINKTIDHDERKSYFIGVLDIAGFEIFKENSLEQLAINYTNERLQQFFNSYMFKLEQEEYEREKIKWEQVNFGLDLQGTIDLLERSGGLLSILDEECIMPKATDETFCEKCHKNFEKANEAIYSKPKIGSKEMFTIKHYAGEVTYTVKDFLSKNMNPLTDDLTQLLQSSENSFIQGLFWGKKGGDSSGHGGHGHSHQIASGRGSVRGKSSMASAQKAQEKVATVVGQHKTQLFSLMNILGSTTPYFVRCIKPNPNKKPGELNCPLVIDQLRCNGVLEGIRIARMGYPNRMIFTDFVKRYRMLCPQQKAPKDPRDNVVFILKECKFPEEFYQIGRTKAFFKVGSLGKLEQMRDDAFTKSAILIQKIARGYIIRRKMRRRGGEAKAALLIQRNVRIWLRAKNNSWYKLYRKIHPLLKPNRIENELKEKALLVATLTQTNEKLETEKQTLQDEYAAVNKQLFMTLADKDKLSAQKSALEQELKDTQENLVSTRASMMKQIRAAETKAQDVSSQLAAAELKIASLEKKIKQLELELRETNEKLDASIASAMGTQQEKQKLQSELLDVRSELEQQKTQTNAATKLVSKLESDIASAHRNLDAVKLEKGEAERVAGIVKQEMETLTEELESERRQKDKLTQTAKMLQGKVNDLTAEVESKGTAVTQVDADKKKLNSEFTALQSMFDNKEAENTKLKAQLKEVEAIREKTQASLEKEIREKSQVSKNASALQTELETIREQLSEEQIAHAGTQKALRTSQTKIEELNNAVEAEQRKTQFANQEKARVIEELSVASAEIVKLNEINGTLTYNFDAATSELEETKEAWYMEQKQSAARERKVKELSYKLDLAREELDKEAETGKQSAKAAYRELDQVKTQLEAEIDASRRQQDVQAQLEKQIQDLMKKTQGVSEKQIAEMKKQHEQALEAVQVALEDNKLIVSKLETEKQRLMSKNQELQSELDALNGTVSGKDSAVRKLTSDSEALKAELATERRSVEELRSNLATLKQEINIYKEKETELEQAHKKALQRQKAALMQESTQLQSDLQDALDKVSKVKKDYTAQLASLEEQLQVQVEKTSKAEKDLSSQELELQRLRAEVKNNATAGKDKDALKVKELQKQLDEINATNEEFKNGVIEARRREKKSKDAATAAEAAAAESEAKAVAAVARMKKLEEDLDASRRETSAAQQQLDQLRRSGLGSGTEVAALKDEVDKLTAEKAKIEKANAQLKVEVKTARDEVEEEEGKTSKVKQQLRQKEEEIATVNAHLMSAQKEASEAKAKLAAMIKDESARNADTDSVAADLERMKRKLNESAREIEELSEQLEEEKNNSKKTVLRLKKKYEEDLDAETTAKAKIAAEKSKLLKTNAILEAELTAVQNRLTEALSKS